VSTIRDTKAANASRTSSLCTQTKLSCGARDISEAARENKISKMAGYRRGLRRDHLLRPGDIAVQSTNAKAARETNGGTASGAAKDGL
jgi:hypothetical protein